MNRELFKANPYKMQLQMFAEGDPPSGGGDPGAAGTPPAGGGTPPAGGKTYTEEELQSIIRTRVAEASQNTAKKYADADKHSQLVQRISKATGKDPDAILAELDQLEQAQNLQHQAQTTGLDPRILAALNNTNSEVTNLKAENQRIQLDLQEKELMTNPYYSSDLQKPEIKEAVREYAETVGCSLEQAFWAVNGSAKAKAIEAETEQRIVAKLKDNGAYAGILSDSAEGFKDLGLTPEELQMADKLGMTAQEYLDSKESANIDSYRSRKKARK